MKFKNHPGALLNKKIIFNLNSTFSFEQIKTNDVYKEIRSLNPKEAGSDSGISAKSFKNCKGSSAPFLKDLFSNIVMTRYVPNKPP